MDVDISRIQLLTRILDQVSGMPDTTDQVLQKSGLSRIQISAPATSYSAHQEALFVRHACDALQNITFAAQAGLGFDVSSSVTAYISKYSRDLRQALENTCYFHWMIDPALSFALRSTGNAAVFEVDWKDPSFRRYHRRTEFLMFAAIARMRNLTQTDLHPLEIRFEHEVGQQAQAYEKIGGFPVTFGAERMEIILSLPSLDTPIPTYEPSLRAHLLEYGERLLAERRSPQQQMRAKVEGLITQSMPGTIIHADDAAAQLGLSPRTLARRLAEEDTTYREIVEDLRCDLAQTFIKNGMALSEIAFSLGYSDQAAFSTAFKRWTGQAPTAFRKRVEHPLNTD
ncbi:AraC family transcriptional regulator [Ruegeria sp. HKCCA6707]|uniref:AraC family transcriptional regulator n=2 Tax=Ruegeria TaxID=97050 RepID=UPI001488DF3F|nr:AraC family transcriptional regulator [Ruegeria sp. HKCCA6707]